MDYKDLTAILIKTAAAVLLFWFLAALPASIVTAAITLKNPAMYQQYADIAPALVILSILLPNLLGLLVALSIFMFPRSVGNKLVQGAPLSRQPQLLDNLQYVALRLIGFFYLYRCVVDLVFYLARVYVRSSQYMDTGSPVPGAWSPDDIAGIASTGVEILLAFWLILGARGIIGIFDRIRGRVEDTAPPADSAGASGG